MIDDLTAANDTLEDEQHNHYCEPLNNHELEAEIDRLMAEIQSRDKVLLANEIGERELLVENHRRCERIDALERVGRVKGGYMKATIRRMQWMEDRITELEGNGLSLIKNGLR